MVGLLSTTGIHEALIAQYDSTGEHREAGWGLKEGLSGNMTQRFRCAREATWGFGDFPVNGPGLNSETLFESCNLEPNFDSQCKNLGGLYCNIDGFIIGTPRDAVGVCGSGTCSHRAGKVTVLSCQCLGSVAQSGVPREPFHHGTGLGNPKDHFCQGLVLWRDSAMCSHSFTVYVWSSWSLPAKSAKYCLLLHPTQYPPSPTHTTLQVH